jgi:AcrR family transcriptional regulator
MRNQARLTRQESQAQTRQSLIDVARRVFLRRGFHAASLEEIALEAAVTKGAIYSNFANKAELFLAVLDQRVENRLAVLAAATFPEEGIEAVARRHARAALAQGPQGVRWASLIAEVWTHAAGDPALRSALAARQDRMQDGVAALLKRIEVTAQVTFALPHREMARAVSAVIRGLLLERLLGSGRPSDAQFEDTVAAFICGLSRPAGRRGKRRDDA